MNEKETKSDPAHATTEKNAKPSAIEALQLENTDLIDTLKRTQAEFENFQKRTAKEKEQSTQYGKALAFKEILEFMDSFDAAIAHVKDDHRKGLDNLRTQLLKILERNGIKPIPTIGKKFNPETQECLMQGNDPMQGDEIVLEEFQKGYTFNTLVLRTAKVKVNAHSATENNTHASTDANTGGNTI
ncbi:MAG: nucleotide exchange factor GrpE [Candidatus Iainarchaeum archaeon]|uniref:Nucleotide exchange factor GrpE n=1 Tax=Candidatus Iainarchaeum sp. TaxID=3101447 RepID=A0A7T9DK85_9ARCH|nr:MAG: nucleotide exchange factor GrpE [Candidatus Diapherotrites archaeon]